MVTGGAGFIGSHLVEILLRENCDVQILDNLHTGIKENVPDGVELIEMDIRDAAVLPLFERENFDAVVHLAGQTMVNVSVADPFFDESVNIHGTVNILEACRRTKVKRIIFASTAAVYGDIEALPICEAMRTEPASFYGLSKLTVEKYLKLYHELYGLTYAVLRFANVYGERQGDGGEGGVISIFTKRVAKGEGIKIFGDGEQTRDFIYVGDVVSGIYQALKAAQVNDVYNLSTNMEASVNEMVGLLQEIAGAEIQIERKPPRAGDIYRSVLSNRKAVDGLTWRPETSLKEGLSKTFRYFVK